VTHYEVLGVTPDAATSEVRRAYVELARRYHPDRTGGDADAMRAINDAWAILSDPARRASYDLALGPAPTPTVAAEPRTPFDLDDLLGDLDDDAPIGGQVVLPRWFSLAAVAAFAGSIGMLVLAVLFTAPPALALAVALFALSCVMFLVAPFVALLASRHRG
jgi:curved DNA-binding protein CbpA